MRLLRHWKMILGLGALYGAGFVTGVVALVLVAVRHPNPDNLGYWADFRLNQYEKRLKLAPDQKAKIKPIVENTRNQIHAIVRLSCEQAMPVLDDAHKKIEAELTPQQRPEFEKISHEVLQRLRDFMQKEAAKSPAAPKPL
jgi:hypothetical protein